MIRIVWGVLLLALCSIAASGQSCILTLNPVTGLFDCKTAAGASTGINNPGVNGIVVCTGTACSGTTAGSLTGDITTPSGSLVTTLASVVSASTCGDATHSCGLTYDAKGRITAATNNVITGTGGSGFTNVFDAVRTSGTVLTFGANCSTTTPCVVHQWDSYLIVQQSFTVTITSGGSASTLHLYGMNGIIYAGITSGAAGLTCSAGCTAVPNETDFPSQVSRLYSWTANVTPGNWDTATPISSGNPTNGYVDYRGIVHSAPIDQGEGVVPLISGNRMILSVDATIIPRWYSQTGAPTSGAGQCSSGRDIDTNTSNNDFYNCVGTAWNKVTGSSGGTGIGPVTHISTTSTTNTVTHNFGAADVVWGCDDGSGIQVIPTSIALNTNTSVFTFATALTTTCRVVGGSATVPLTTKGDLFTFDTANQRLAVGANGTVLTADSTAATGIKWATVSGTGTVTSSGSPAIHQVPVFTTGTDIKGITVGTTDKPLVGVSSADPVWSKLTLTNPATAATLTVADGASLITSGAFSLTLAATATTVATFPAGTKTLLATDGSAAALTSFPTLNQNTTGSAATLTTPRAINGTNFDGSAAITVTAAAGTLTGTTLNATVVTSSLTSVGTLAGLTATGAVDFGGSSSTKIRVAAGLTTATNGFVGYDSTNNMLHGSQSGADAFIPQFTATPANNDCVKWTVSGSNYKLGTAGAACGTGGTVTVVSAGSLTSTALVTGGGTTTLQTPSATATMDSSGNISTPGTVTSGAGGSVGGAMGLGQGTATTAASGIVGWMAPTSVTTPYYMKLPAAPTTGFLLNTGTTDPSTITFVSAIGLTSQVTGTLPLANGGTNGTDSASNGGIIWSNASGYKVLAGTATANQVLLSGSTATPAWSSATYPASTTANRILYSSATNTVGQITSLANGVLVTDGSSVPSIQVSLPSGLAATNFSLTTPTVTGIMSYQANIRQTFNPGSTVAGLNIGAVAVAPSTPINGDIWYDSTGNKFKCQEGSSTVNCLVSLNGLTITSTTGTLTIPSGVTMTGPSSSATVATLGLTNTFTGRQDASGAASTAPAKVGTSLPGTCVVGDLYFKSDATAGQNIYQCQTTNTWTQQLNSGSGTAGGGFTGYSAPALTLTAGTRYAPMGGGGIPSTTETDSQVAAPSAATIQNLQVSLSVAPGSGQTAVFTVRKATADTTLTCTISNAATSCADTTHSFTAAQGDLLDMKVVTTGTYVSTPMVSWLVGVGSTLSSGSVNSGTSGQMTYYGGTGTAVSGNANFTVSGSDFTIGVAGSAVGTLSFGNATSGTIKVSPATGALGSSVWTIPVATDTFVGKATTDTLTNKTLTSPTLTTPVLGTPSSGTLTNVTGLPVGGMTIAAMSFPCNITSGSAAGTACSFGVVPQQSKSAAYTTTITDAGNHIYHPGADTTARTWTIDSNANVAYPVGTCITFINDTSGGVITIAITTDTMILAGAGTTGSRTLAANGVATACKMTTTRWIINGTGLTFNLFPKRLEQMRKTLGWPESVGRRMEGAAA